MWGVMDRVAMELVNFALYHDAQPQEGGEEEAGGGEGGDVWVKVGGREG